MTTAVGRRNASSWTCSSAGDAGEPGHDPRSSPRSDAPHVSDFSWPKNLLTVGHLLRMPVRHPRAAGGAEVLKSQCEQGLSQFRLALSQGESS